MEKTAIEMLDSEKLLKEKKSKRGKLEDKNTRGKELI